MNFECLDMADVKKLCFVVSVIVSLAVFANDYTPFVREGVKWKYIYNEYYSFNDTCTEKTMWFTIKGDSVVGDCSYKKCLYWYDNEEPTFATLLREDVENRTVYMKTKHGAEYVLYDFNDISNCYYMTYHDIADDDIDISKLYCSGVELKKYFISKYNYTFIESIGFISAVGAATMLLFPYIPETEDGIMRRYDFEALTDIQGNVLYDAKKTGDDNVVNKDMVMVIVENNHITIKSTDVIDGIKVVALNGQIIATAFPKNEVCEMPVLLNKGYYIVDVLTQSGNAIKNILVR